MMQPWETPAQAGWIYWLIVFIVGGGLLAFALWALYGRMRVGRPTTGRYHALGALVIVMVLFTLTLYLIVATQAEDMPPTARAWNWQPTETLKDPGGSGLMGEPYRGYLVYLANGCTYCHTLYLRPQDVRTGWGEGATEADVSQAGDYVHYPFALLGTQRDGPDLTIIGKKIPDMKYQIAHLKDPRQFKPRSIMPTYRYLSEEDLRDLAAFLISLGNPPDKLRAGQVAPPAPAGLSSAAKKGEALYRSLGCVGCHTIDGAKNVGPTWKGLYDSQVELADGSTVTADYNYLAESIKDPAAKVVNGFPNMMPPFSNLSSDELNELIEYIESLK